MPGSSTNVLEPEAEANRGRFSWAARLPERQPLPPLRAMPPGVEPGQLWLIETGPDAAALAPLQRRALMGANVVVYDRPLAGLVAELLPSSAYAEPAADPLLDEATFERCLRFARDGWSVVRAVDAGRAALCPADRLGQASRRLLAAGVAPDLPVFVVADTGGGSSHVRRIRLAELDAASGPRMPAPPIAAVFGPIAAGAPAPYHIVSNGLAG
jgi:siroheme synthase